MRAATRIFLGVCLTVILASCGGGDGPTEPERSPLEDVTLTANTTPSLGKVYVQGLPLAKLSTLDDYSAQILADGTDPIEVPMEEDDAGLYFRSTLHPVTPNGGGTVRVSISDGTNSSPELDLQIDPLPAAPGAYRAVVEALRAHVAQRAQWAGTTFDELAATSFDAIPNSLLSLKVAQSYIDGNGPNDLTSLIDNTSGWLNPTERELLDRIFGFARLDSVVRADIEDFGRGTSRPRNSASSGLEKRSCIDLGPEISTAQELVDAMVLAKLGASSSDPNGAGRYLQALGWVFTGGGVLPGVGKVFTVAGVGLAVWQASVAAVSGIYPSSLTELEYDLDKIQWEEDDDAPGTWSNVMVTAKSTGWVADADLLNVVVTALSGYVSVAQSTRFDAVNALADFEVATMNSELQSRLDTSGGVIEFCPKTWQVDISAPAFSTAAALAHHFDVNRQNHTLVPSEVGADQLRVATIPGLFAGQDVHLDKSVECKAIDVAVTPTIVLVDHPGEEVSISATIENAEVTSLYWAAAQGSWNDGIGADTNGSASRPLLTPADARAYPFRVEVESTSSKGLRASGQPRRYGFAEVRLNRARLEISPRDTCVQPGDTVQFTATVSGLENYEVAWSKVSGYGNIDQNGLYHSISGGVTEAMVAANVVGMEEIGDTTSVSMRGCNCYYRANLGVASFGGGDVAYIVSDLGDLIYTFFFENTTPADDGLSISIVGSPEQPAPRPGDTGSYDVNLAFFVGNQSWVAGAVDEESSATLLLDELTETFMRGTVTGTAIQRGIDGNVVSSIPIYIEFQAGHMVDGWPCE